LMLLLNKTRMTKWKTKNFKLTKGRGTSHLEDENTSFDTDLDIRDGDTERNEMYKSFLVEDPKSGFNIY